MRVLITGGAGFIGSHLVRRCLAKGWRVDVCDDLSSGRLDDLPAGQPCTVADFADQAVLAQVRRTRYDAIFHLAALPRVAYSVEHPLAAHDVNVTRTLRLVDAVRAGGGRLIFASSSAVYGDALDLPTRESALRAPRSPYALQKAIIEDYLRLYAELYGLVAASLRFFNIYGPRQRGDSAHSTAIAAWIDAARAGKPLRSDGDGDQSRDWCHVDDAVEACVLAARCPEPLAGQAFNVGSGTRTTNAAILEMITRRFTGAQRVDAPRRIGDVLHTQADLARSHAVLGFSPSVTLAAGLARTIAWYEGEQHSLPDRPVSPVSS